MSLVIAFTPEDLTFIGSPPLAAGINRIGVPGLQKLAPQMVSAVVEANGACDRQTHTFA
jgi:hypothetical protein